MSWSVMEATDIRVKEVALDGWPRINQTPPARAHACGKGGRAHDAFLRLARNGIHGRHIDLTDAIIGESEERWGEERIRTNICVTLCVTPDHHAR